jgi:hypothetical protein
MITPINVFVVDPVHQRMVINLLVPATEEFVSDAPAFYPPLCTAAYGTKVTMHAQWSSA